MSSAGTAAVVAALLAAGAVLLALPPRSRMSTLAAPQEEAREAVAGLLRWRPVLSIVALAGGWSVLGGSVGALAGLASAATVWVVLGRTEDPRVRRRREELAADLPVAVDLFGACLAAGAAPESALQSSGEALGGPVAEEFRAVHHRLQLGLAPSEVWASVARDPVLAPLGRAMARTHETGASVEASVRLLAAELRERAAAEVEEQARGIEVRAAAPLGLCLLPAFTLLGVVPMVASVFASMRLF